MNYIDTVLKLSSNEKRFSCGTKKGKWFLLLGTGKDFVPFRTKLFKHRSPHHTRLGRGDVRLVGGLRRVVTRGGGGAFLDAARVPFRVPFRRRAAVDRLIGRRPPPCTRRLLERGDSLPTRARTAVIVAAGWQHWAGAAGRRRRRHTETTVHDFSVEVSAAASHSAASVALAELDVRPPSVRRRSVVRSRPIPACRRWFAGASGGRACSWLLLTRVVAFASICVCPCLCGVRVRARSLHGH